VIKARTTQTYRTISLRFHVDKKELPLSLPKATPIILLYREKDVDVVPFLLSPNPRPPPNRHNAEKALSSTVC
jgi:hypothetical protein